MDWLLRPERGDFRLLRWIAGFLAVFGAAVVVLSLLFGIGSLLLALGQVGTGFFTLFSLVRTVMFVCVGLTMCVAGHLLRALALILARRIQVARGTVRRPYQHSSVQVWARQVL